MLFDFLVPELDAVNVSIWSMVCNRRLSDVLPIIMKRSWIAGDLRLRHIATRYSLADRNNCSHIHEAVTMNLY